MKTGFFLGLYITQMQKKKTRTHTHPPTQHYSCEKVTTPLQRPLPPQHNKQQETNRLFRCNQTRDHGKPEPADLRLSPHGQRDWILSDFRLLPRSS